MLPGRFLVFNKHFIYKKLKVVRNEYDIRDLDFGTLFWYFSFWY